VGVAITVAPARMLKVRPFEYSPIGFRFDASRQTKRECDGEQDAVYDLDAHEQGVHGHPGDWDDGADRSGHKNSTTGDRRQRTRHGRVVAAAPISGLEVPTPCLCE
jgi:hypothetical protein